MTNLKTLSTYLLLFVISIGFQCCTSSQENIKTKEDKIIEMEETPKKVIPKEPPLPLNQELIKKSWDAYNEREYQSAINFADTLISIFEDEGVRIQKDLIRKKIPVPPVGTIENEELEKEIFSRGAMNNLATCYYIKGVSYAKLGLIQKSNGAFKNARRFPHARTYDPLGKWFWSPSVISEAVSYTHLTLPTKA